MIVEPTRRPAPTQNGGERELSMDVDGNGVMRCHL